MNLSTTFGDRASRHFELKRMGVTCPRRRGLIIRAEDEARKNSRLSVFDVLRGDARMIARLRLGKGKFNRGAFRADELEPELREKEGATR